MKEKIFVIGATGNVGREVVKNLQEMGQAIIAGVRDEGSAYKVPAGENTSIAIFDFEKPDTFPALFTDVKKLFLMRPPQIADVEQYLFPAIDAAKQAGVELISFLSLMGIEDNKWAPHYAVEKYLETCGVPYIFIRPSFYMQNFSGTHARDICEQDEILLPAGRGRNSFIDTRDIGAVTAKTLVEPGHENQAYTLTGREALSYAQAAEIFTEVLGREIQYNRPSPLRFHRHMLRKHKVPSKFVWVMQVLYLTVRLNKGSFVNDTVQRILGQPAITLRQFVKDYQEIWQPPCATR